MNAGATVGPGLNSPEPARDPGHDLAEHRRPTGRVHAMGHGHRTILRSPHSSGDHAVVVPVPGRPRHEIMKLGRGARSGPTSVGRR